MNTIASCEIICVGTELLLGEIVNTNAAFLSRRLADIGINVYHQSVVGDNARRLAEAIRTALGRCELLILTGGLGPTYDDLTKETVASVSERALKMDPVSLERIRSYFKLTGRAMTQNNEKQALIPEGAKAIQNNYGTAPGIYLETNDNVIVMLPGPPNELEPMFDEQVVPLIMQFTDGGIVSKSINIMGMGESAIEARLKELMLNSTNPTIAPYAKFGEVRLRVSAKSSTGDEGEAMALCNEMVERIKNTEIGEFIYGIDEPSITHAALKRLRKLGLKVATAESCTGGLVAKKLTDLAGSSDSFVSGVVSYCNEVKMQLLGVAPEIIAAHTEVSHECVCAMAEGVRKLLGADVGIATTGYAGPGGGNERDPVGTVYIAISTADNCISERLSYSSMRDRNFIREAAAARALLLIIKHLH